MSLWLYPGAAVVSGLRGEVRTIERWDAQTVRSIDKAHRLQSRRAYYRRNAKRLAASALRRMTRLKESRA